MDYTFKPGDTISVHQKISEGDKTRIQIYTGIVLALNKTAKSFTVRKISEGVGVERIWRLDNPNIEKIEIKKVASGQKRSKLYYLRGLTEKQVAKILA
ncbi:50S ribosomal protein L19 [Candidatus Gottesmanbacteria bacterium RIFCSPHIGHO2_01_FULL_42_12]|uniref:50S ribosomal protein L19 n=1 Tax=Candidatus Gottesmanbacteria bacterium RIFCSPHIGHO2_01_FULL_42_12 TaxID=1798377 RepID=A0A1F5YZR9_9BACT|nr:MAG: 50S ribosomal protein L19 [Candidatus Gottesmanbacteria bacterium RIFCSPHIGHO2_01_FULL_42_12]